MVGLHDLETLVASDEKRCADADDSIDAAAFGGLHPSLADSRMSCRLARRFQSRSAMCGQAQQPT